MVPLDGSSLAERALPVARVLAQKFDSQIILLRVLDIPSPTSPTSHLEVTSDALDLPLKGILVEKPLADNWADGRQILNLVRAKGLPLAVPHGLLVAEHARQILDRVREGQIGDLELVEIQCTGWDIINAGIHWLNYALELLQGERMEWVMACCDTLHFNDPPQRDLISEKIRKGEASRWKWRLALFGFYWLCRARCFRPRLVKSVFRRLGLTEKEVLDSLRAARESGDSFRDVFRLEVTRGILEQSIGERNSVSPHSGTVPS